MNQKIIEAIESKTVIEFDYEGGMRTVEPHCYGVTTAGNEGLRAHQTAGYSSSGKLTMKMFDLGKASNIRLTEKTFDGPRPIYKRGDKGMSRIYKEL